MKLKGYTLSEIMIALVVLGTIIACCMPIIANMAPNKNAIMLKKAYFTTQQIISDLVNDAYYYPNGNLKDDTQAVTVQGTDIQVAGDDKFPCLFASKLNLALNNLDDICSNPVTVTTVEGLTFNLRTEVTQFKHSVAPSSNDMDISRLDVAVTDDIEKSQYNVSSDCIDPAYYTGWGGNQCGGTTHINKIGKMAMFIHPDGKLSLQTDNSNYGAYNPAEDGLAQGDIIDIITGKISLLGKPKN